MACLLVLFVCFLFKRKVQDSTVGQANRLLPPSHPWSWDACGDQGSRHKGKHMRDNFPWSELKMVTNECAMFHKCKLRFAKWYNLVVFLSSQKYWCALIQIQSNLKTRKTILQNTLKKIFAFINLTYVC